MLIDNYHIAVREQPTRQAQAFLAPCYPSTHTEFASFVTHLWHNRKTRQDHTTSHIIFWGSSLLLHYMLSKFLKTNSCWYLDEETPVVTSTQWMHQTSDRETQRRVQQRPAGLTSIIGVSSSDTTIVRIATSHCLITMLINVLIHVYFYLVFIIKCQINWKSTNYRILMFWFWLNVKKLATL